MRRHTRFIGIAVVFTFFVAFLPAVHAVDPDFSVCLDEFNLEPLVDITFSIETGPSRLDSLTSEGYPNAAAAKAGSTWDFTSVTGSVYVSQTAPVSSLWSCTVGGGCPSFDPSIADVLMVQDNLDWGTREIGAMSRVGNAIMWRGQVDNEGQPDEQRFCTESDIAFFVFPGPGDCLENGDSPWTSRFDCDKGLVLNDPCGTDDPMFGLDGRFDGQVVQAGTLTLPSGHVLDSLLLEIHLTLDLRQLVGDNCTSIVDSISQYMFAWMVPVLGNIVMVHSPDQTVDPFWEEASSTNIGFGLLPPLNIWVTETGVDTLTVAWDPGLDTRFIDEYIVYWGEESGLIAPPPYSSELAGHSIPVTQTNYTIEGLSPGTTYFISVTTKRSYTDPVNGVTTIYQSIALPTSIGSDINGDGIRETSYPPEVSAATQTSRYSLLRNWATSIAPIDPPLGDILPLDPVLDEHVPDFNSGDIDPDGGVLDDQNRPLVFYSVHPAVAIRLDKTPDRHIRVEFF